MKSCTRCGIEKALEQFSRESKAKDGRRSACKTCIAAEGVAYRAAKGEVLLRKAAEYRSKLDPKKMAEYKADYYQANKSRLSKKMAENYEANKEARKEAAARWRLENPEAKRASHATRRARKRNSGGKHAKEDIKFLMSSQKCKCPACGVSIKNGYHIDHIIPLAMGGSNDKTNIQLLCPKCNMSKKAKHPVEFMRQKGFLL